MKCTGPELSVSKYCLARFLYPGRHGLREGIN